MTTRTSLLLGHISPSPTTSSSPSSSNSKTMTKAELSHFTGDNNTPVYICLKGAVFDVTSGKSFYGPGGGYSILAGKDASRALAKMDLSNDAVSDPRVDDLTAKEQDTLDNWYARLKSKYPVVAQLSK